MEENNKGNTQQNIQNGQSGQGTQQGGNFVVGNDTTSNSGTGGVISLKGGITQKEIDEQKRIEKLKNGAIKLKRKLAPKEKELEELHKQAVNTVPVDKNNFAPKGMAGSGQNIVMNKKFGRAKQRMVISPTGQISYVNKQKKLDNYLANTPKKQEKVAIEKKTLPKIETKKSVVNNKQKIVEGNVINLKKTTGLENLENYNSGKVGQKIAIKKNNNKIEKAPWEEEKVDLTTLTPEKRISLQATPSMASVNFNMDDDLNKEMVAWFDNYNKLPINIKLGLGSLEVNKKIKDFAEKFKLIVKENSKLTEGNLGEISRIVRDVYVNLIKSDEIESRLINTINVGKKEVKDALKNIASIVSLVKNVGNKKSEEYFEKLSLKDALEKYPSILLDEITSGMLVDKKTGKYVKPTVQNWINDYINEMGSGEHTKLSRGKYLNDTTNVKNLDKEDKQIIEKLVKAQDEKTVLVVDREENVILWRVHNDESQLGINSDKNKRVINKFKIEEAQTSDHEINNLQKNRSNKKDTKKQNNLANTESNSIIKKKVNKSNSFEAVKKGKDGVLDLSSEIPIKK